eukprot:TRINITY_DN9663_c0_g1_i1.p1 TRINITY_DN9663_c0_g1~~TRINITY_DN9663_c0_g1_i1.p1  ORF type:complete len:228 (-),score=32.19 TRINITY_DN9663_c0_g1_i1:95-685(-)
MASAAQANNGIWRRCRSSGDIVAMGRTPTRRPFDSAQPSEELLSSPCNSAKHRQMTLHDPVGRMTRQTYRQRSPKHDSSELPPWDRTNDRAMDFWKLGEGLRIMNHIQPTKLRQISLVGEVYQGFYIHDWKPVEARQSLRNTYPWSQRDSEVISGKPFPQGPTQAELHRNRNFDWSHGSVRKTGGYMVNGQQVMIP